MTGTGKDRVELVIIDGGRAGGGAPPPTGPEDYDGGDGGPRPIWCSDDALAAELVKDLAGNWRYASSGEWYRWDGKRWEAEKTALVWHRSRMVCRRIAQMLDNQNLARRISSSQTIHAVVKVASTDPRVAMRVEEFDRDIWLLNTQSGIVDLRNGQLHPHDRAQLMTRITAAAPAAPGAGGDCPRWQQFLRDATGKDEAFAKYLQRVAGYLLTGSIEEHAVFFLYGPGGTGKSTFQNVMSWLLADYATTAMMDLFTVSTGERHPAELATLLGRRLVVAGEVDGAKRWDEAKLKAITGGDRISARFMRGDPFTFAPQFKLLLAGNDRPRMRGADDAMRRRFHLLPFLHKPPAPDKELDAKLRGELPGILAWAIEGEVLRRRLGGLMPPKAVVEATDEYFETENTIGRWIEERCVKGPQEFALTRDLYRDFQSWARLAGEFVLSEKLFSERLALRGDVHKDRHPVTRRMGFRGLAPLHADGELPFGVPPAAGEGTVVSVNSMPREPVADPADEYER